MNPLKMDFHMHTTVSDGTDTPEMILERVRQLGIQMFSVTDHDALKGCKVIQSVLAENDPVFVSGVEFSCRDEDGQYHILGYGYDVDSPAIRQVVEMGHQYRMNKVRAKFVSKGSIFVRKRQLTGLSGAEAFRCWHIPALAAEIS